MQKKLAYRYKSYIAIGSNVGNWKSNFNNALNLMNKSDIYIRITN